MNLNDAVCPECEFCLPAQLREFVGGHFRLVGVQFLNYLKDLVDLKPNERILDVGCGCGRIALPLATYLNSEGTYDGFDIDKNSIHWCVENISSRYPNFRFQCLDLYNKRYNPKGTLLASSFRFSYDKGSFDVVLLASVFTHMLKNDMHNYFSQISRVLSENGRCLITFFLFNESEQEKIDMNRREIKFEYISDKHQRVADKKEAEGAIAYDEGFIRELYAENGLIIKGPIRYGFQDIIAAVKEGNP